jgi:TetR/AcrR family transcriptional regulator, cholesterol catabolism regulator
VEVTERHLERHRAGLTRAIDAAAPDVRSSLRAAADWLLSQPPLDLIRLSRSDLPAIGPANAARLSRAAFTALLLPIEAALRQAEARREIAHHDLGLIAGGLLGMIESLFAVPDGVLPPARQRREMAHDLVDTLLDGLRRPR